MPHQCTNCGRSFADGSKEMLGGCPDCGGNRFQFAPKGRLERSGTDGPADGQGRRSADRPTDDEGRSATGENRPANGGDRPAGRSGSPPEPASTSDGADDGREAENAAQAEARSEVVSSTDLPPRATDSAGNDRSGAAGSDRAEGGAAGARDEPPEHGRVVSEPDGADRPSMEELREELDDQFESIKIVQPGRYELNLMELYDREEYIVSLQEDGRYVIDVPDSWRESDES